MFLAGARRGTRLDALAHVNAVTLTVIDREVTFAAPDFTAVLRLRQRRRQEGRDLHVLLLALGAVPVLANTTLPTRWMLALAISPRAAATRASASCLLRT